MKTSCQKTIYVWHDRQVNALVSNNLRRLWQVLMLFINTIITFPVINIKIECNARRAFSNKIFKPGASSGYIVVSMKLCFGWNYLLSHWLASFQLTHSFLFVPFLYPLIRSENVTVFWCFQGAEKGYIGNEWVNNYPDVMHGDWRRLWVLWSESSPVLGNSLSFNTFDNCSDDSF